MVCMPLTIIGNNVEEVYVVSIFSRAVVNS